MFSVSKPTKTEVDSYLHQQSTALLSYDDVGATRNEGRPNGYRNIDHNRILLGHGEQAFTRARDALRAWKMFDIGWVSVAPSQSPIEVGNNVAICIHHLGFWSMNAARIVYNVDDAGLSEHSVERFGFAYGTLSDHAESGEERFMVEWNRADDSVWYDIYAFSRPRHALAKIGYVLARMLQKKFVRDSMQAMVRAAQ